MCVDEDFPKTAFIDNATAYFLSKRKNGERTKYINKAEKYKKMNNPPIIIFV